MSKIVALQGSFRANGLTSKMLKYAVEEARNKGHEVVEINLHEKNIGYCKGCRKCLETVDCVFMKDDLHTVAEEIKSADVIMLAAPVYWANVPAVVKNLFDRLSGTAMEETKTFPKPRFKGKRYIFFTACNTPMPFAHLCGQTTGIKRAVKEFFKTAGVKHIGTVVCANTGVKKEVDDKRLKKIEKLIERL